MTELIVTDPVGTLGTGVLVGGSGQAAPGNIMIRDQNEALGAAVSRTPLWSNLCVHCHYVLLSLANKQLTGLWLGRRRLGGKSRLRGSRDEERWSQRSHQTVRQ